MQMNIKNAPTAGTPDAVKSRVIPDSGTAANNFLAQRNRAWVAGLPPHVGIETPSNVPTLVAIGGGKGGVGKSFVAANLAAKLGERGFKVLLVDLDMGGANLHTYVGMAIPSRTLIDFVVYESLSFSEVIQRTPSLNVDLIAGGKDEMWSFEGDTNATGTMNGLWKAILNCRNTHGYDFVLLDLGAGTHRYTVDFFAAAHMGIVTVLPEPTSIENAYTFLKASVSRLIDNVGMQLEEFSAANAAKACLGSPVAGGIAQPGTYAEKLRGLYGQYPEFVTALFYALSGRQMGFVVNQIRSQRDIDIGFSMETICNGYFSYQSHFLGYINYDDAAWKSLRNRRLMVGDFPHATLTKRIHDISGNLVNKLGF
jgi:flagellar biosynthesis protein FlhG